MKSILLLFIILIVTGCSSTYRGIPSHGGGKRFSEEQRMVTGAIRQAVAAMDVSELKGKRVAVKLTGIPTSGSGNINWGGVTANLNGYDRVTRTILDRVTSPNFKDDTESHSSGGGGSMSFRPNHNFYASNTNTDRDTTYLQAALQMMAMHQGIRFTNQNADATLHVLVDVLGTNRSRANWLIFHVDKLLAECELSYYAVDAKKQSFIFPNRRCSAEGVYSQTRCIVAPLPTRIKRKITPTVPTKLPDNSGKPVIIPPNGGKHPPVPAKAPENMNSEEKNAYLQNLASRVRSQLNSGQVREAQQTLQQMVTVDPNYEELPDLKEQVEDEQDEK